jgi:hypothetical protein
MTDMPILLQSCQLVKSYEKKSVNDKISVYFLTKHTESRFQSTATEYADTLDLFVPISTVEYKNAYPVYHNEYRVMSTAVRYRTSEGVLLWAVDCVLYSTLVY